jgi:protein involved in plasmid replication-relaxation
MRSGGDRVLRMQAYVTYRDRLLLDWLYDHQVLTTFQIAHALFGSLDFAQRRLLRLHRLGLLERFRPLRAGGGSYPWHYVLDQLGAEIVAASRDEPAPRPAEATARRRRVATSRTLDHLLGVNQFFTDLAGHARTHPPARLERWWSERQCARPGAWGGPMLAKVRPDGHGVFTDGNRRVAFFVEHDVGGEQLGVLAAKLTGYTALAADGGPAWPVLFWLPTAARERHLHRLLDDADVWVPVATAARDSLQADISPADPVWLVHGADDAPRGLVDLAGLGDPPPRLADRP